MIGIRRKQRRAARTERAVENDFDRALREMVIEAFSVGAVFQQSTAASPGPYAAL